MIDRYLKEKNVTIHDNINGTYTVTYQDNIDELIKLENEIEILNQALNRLNSKEIRTYNRFSNIRNFLKKVITILSMFLLFRISVVNDLKDFQILIPFISISVIS